MTVVEKPNSTPEVMRHFHKLQEADLNEKGTGQQAFPSKLNHLVAQWLLENNKAMASKESLEMISPLRSFGKNQ